MFSAGQRCLPATASLELLYLLLLLLVMRKETAAAVPLEQVLVVGDSGLGKTTLVKTLLSTPGERLQVCPAAAQRTVTCCGTIAYTLAGSS